MIYRPKESAPDLFRPKPPKFGGETFDQEQDGKRLSRQLDSVRALMLDGKWRTLAEIHAAVGGSEAGISARLRDLRKPMGGSYVVVRRRVEAANGLHEYRIATELSQ